MVFVFIYCGCHNNDVRFRYVGISFFLGISSIQSSFGDESTADTPLQSPIKQEEVRNGRWYESSCIFYKLGSIEFQIFLLLSILQPHLEPLLVVRSISYVSIKKVKEINLKSHTFLEPRKSVSIATISFRGLSMTLFAALQVQGVLCVRVNCRGHHLILFYS